MEGEGTISKYQKDKMKKTQHIGAALKGGRVNLRLLKNREGGRQEIKMTNKNDTSTRITCNEKSGYDRI